MSQSKNNFRKRCNLYYRKVLLQFLGLERELFVHTEHSCKFYYQNKVVILWFGANKIQEAQSGRWINEADEFIIRNILSDKSAPKLKEFTA